MTECNIDKSHLILYLYNELEEKEKSIFEKHLQTCQGCQTEIQDYKEILNKLASLPSLEPSKLLFIEDNSNRKKDKVISFITYGVIAASFICLAIITYFKLPILKPTDTNQPSYAVPKLRSGEGQQPIVQAISPPEADLPQAQVPMGYPRGDNGIPTDFVGSSKKKTASDTQNKPFISTYEDAEICSWDNTFTDEIAALQESAITFTANIKTTPLISLDESIENIDKNIKSIFAKSND